MNKIGIFIDDERNPEDVTWVQYPDDITWFVVTRMNDFIFVITQSDVVDYVSFDHDLQDFDLLGKENTGYDCLKFLVRYYMDNDKPLPTCFFHTQNPVGKENMMCYYENAIKHFGVL